MNIGLFYGSSTCYTEIVAEKIQSILTPDMVTLHNVADSPLSSIQDYSVLIFGIPTWDFGEIQTDWSARWTELDELDLTGKICAIYGLGDQATYGEWFLDAMGLLHDKLIARGAQIVGYWPTTGYEFEASKAVTPDGQFFVGLAIDEVNQYDQTETRVQQWLHQILDEIAELS